jgi:ribose transport system substrate-binding protein
MEELTQRQISILKWIAARENCSLKDVSKRFELSRETIRQELNVLEELGFISRKSGIITYLNNSQNMAELLEMGGVTKQQRREQILNLLSRQNEIRISLLAKKLKVSSITIRNDLAALELEGKILRKHGCATLFEHSNYNGNKSVEDDFPLKVRILGNHTMVHISLGESVFLSHGVVNEYVAASFPPFSNISVVTNSFSIINVLHSKSYTYPIFVTSNFFSNPSNRFLMRSEDNLPDDLHIDKVFICCSSFNNRIFYLDDHEDLTTIEKVCKRAKKIYLILDTKYVNVPGALSFEYRQYLDKIQEILIDDGISSFRASVLFSRQDPIVICGQDTAYRLVRKQKFRIGFLVNKDRNSFIQSVHNGILEASAASSSLFLVIRECERDYASTVENLNKLIDEGVDLIIDYSLCSESLLYVGDRCLNKGIKLISVDYLSPGAIYFGADNAMAGKIAGRHAVKYINKVWEKPLEHLVILGKFGHEPITKLRISSALEEVKQVSNRTTSTHLIEWGHPEIQPTQELITLLKSVPKTENMLIMAFNLRHLLAAYDIILQYRNSGNTAIVGQNHTKQIEEFMKEHDSPIIGCVHYNPEIYGESIIDIALRMLNNNDVPERNYTKLTWVERKTLVTGTS